MRAPVVPDAIPTPGVNSRVSLQLGEGARTVPSRIEDTRPGELVVAAPVDLPPEEVPLEGDVVLVGWASRSGWNQVPVVVRSVHRRPVPALHTSVAGPVTSIQRRAYARAPENGPAEIVIGELTVIGHLLDLSEGGLRCVVGVNAPLEQGDCAGVRFVIDAEPVNTDANIVRTRARSGVSRELGLAFVAIDSRDGDRIRRHVFAKQARMRLLGLT